MSIIKNLCRDYGDFKLAIPQWELSDKGITALCGPSGSGKTSVIRLLLGLEHTPGLSWIFAGVDLAALPIEKRRLGVVFQSYQLFPHMTARENIVFAARARGFSATEYEPKILQMVEQLSLQKCIDRSTSQLSGGECQRVALARALIGQPRFLFLDEPFSALDAAVRGEARALVREMVSAYGIPTLLVSHDEADIQALAQHVVHIDGGRLVPPRA